MKGGGNECILYNVEGGSGLAAKTNVFPFNILGQNS